MRHAVLLIGLLTLAASPSCASKTVGSSAGADPLTAGENSPATTASGDARAPADPDDPYGACVLGSSSAPEIHHYVCTVDGIDCTGWGHGQGSNGHESGTYHVVCDHTCESDGDCPVPGTGDARPVCLLDVHACELPCDDGTACPNGYDCQSTQEWGLSHGDGTPIPLPRICMQTLTE